MTVKALIAKARAILPREGRILFGVLGLVLCGWLFATFAGQVSAGRTQGFDERVLLALRRADDPAVPIGPRWALPIALEFTALGSGIVLFTVIAVVGGYLALERRHRMMWLTIGASVGGMILSSALKGLFERDRPSVVPHLAIVSSASFPSGHSMLAAVVYLTLGALLARTTRDWRLRTYYVGVAVCLAFLIGVSRVYLGVHYPTDVMAGWAAGTIWALGWEIGARLLERRGALKRSPAPAAASAGGRTSPAH
ncbi:MAG: phosphatase PAP2 family protein [Candidatus Binatia bacterium]